MPVNFPELKSNLKTARENERRLRKAYNEGTGYFVSRSASNRYYTQWQEAQQQEAALVLEATKAALAGEITAEQLQELSEC